MVVSIEKRFVRKINAGKDDVDSKLSFLCLPGWCHVVCALYIPEAWFGNVQTMEPIILKGLPPERFNKVSEGSFASFLFPPSFV